MDEYLSKSEIELAIDETKSMAEAAKKLNVNYKTLRIYAKKFEIFIPNQSGKGITKELKKIEDTKRGFHVKNKLWKLGLKKKICEKCNLGDTWLGEPIMLELHHIDGNKFNNVIENLQILCPNCHSQTNNYRGKNIKKCQDVVKVAEGDLKFPVQ